MKSLAQPSEMLRDQAVHVGHPSRAHETIYALIRASIRRSKQVMNVAHHCVLAFDTAPIAGPSSSSLLVCIPPMITHPLIVYCNCADDNCARRDPSCSALSCAPLARCRPAHLTGMAMGVSSTAETRRQSTVPAEEATSKTTTTLCGSLSGPRQGRQQQQ